MTMRMSTNMFIFAAGAAIGSAVTWFYAKKYYEKIANDEIDSMKEWLARRVEEQDKREEPDEAAGLEEEEDEDEVQTLGEDKDEYGKYEKIVEKLSYNNYYHGPAKEVDDMDEPYVIKPEIFGEEDDYEEVSLTYYADGVLCDERDNRIEDIAGTVGEDYAEHFGDFEDDSVFVRNDRLKTDFEILKDWRNYSDLDKRGDE